MSRIDGKVAGKRAAESLVGRYESAQPFVDLPILTLRRCWTACMTSKRMPTPNSVMTASPSKVESKVDQELKSRPRMARFYLTAPSSPVDG
jgi:hypothetical protein